MKLRSLCAIEPFALRLAGQQHDDARRKKEFFPAKKGVYLIPIEWVQTPAGLSIGLRAISYANRKRILYMGQHLF